MPVNVQPHPLASSRMFLDIETEAHEDAEKWLGIGEPTAHDLTIEQLKTICGDAGLEKGGKKDDLIKRIYLEPIASTSLDEVLDSVKAFKRDEALAKAPLDHDLGKIRTIGAASNDGEIAVGIVWKDEDESVPKTFGNQKNRYAFQVVPYENEAELIDAFWHNAVNHRLRMVGYNILNFDIPYLLRRSLDLGLWVPPKLNLRRYQIEPICDLMQILAHWDSRRYKSLKFICNRYGIENPMPDIDGSMVATLNDPMTCRYQASDVHIIRELWKRMDGVYWPQTYNVPTRSR
ncbi:MAG: hypothetical protein GTO24_21340 [candidate division Zixibacteria bacterium]|nr:hypothetical protein [candidate division Zixibacteria bacterium]